MRWTPTTFQFIIHPDVWDQALKTFRSKPYVAKPENLWRPDVNRHMLYVQGRSLPERGKFLKERIRL